MLKGLVNILFAGVIWFTSSFNYSIFYFSLCPPSKRVKCSPQCTPNFLKCSRGSIPPDSPRTVCIFTAKTHPPPLLHEESWLRACTLFCFCSCMYPKALPSPLYQNQKRNLRCSFAIATVLSSTFQICRNIVPFCVLARGMLLNMLQNLGIFQPRPTYEKYSSKKVQHTKLWENQSQTINIDLLSLFNLGISEISNYATYFGTFWKA